MAGAESNGVASSQSGTRGASVEHGYPTTAGKESRREIFDSIATCDAAAWSHRVDYHPRPELEARLSGSIETYLLTLIVAPAGSGKTAALTFLRRRAEKRGIRWCWYDCGSPSAVPGGLISGLRSLLQAMTGEKDGGGLTSLLLIDNYHLCENPQINTMLLDLIAAVRGRLRIVVCSRVTPRLAVGGLRLHSALGEFSRKDLALHPREVARFLDQPETRVDAGQREAILTRCDGWAAGIEFIRQRLVEGAETVEAAVAEAEKSIRDYIEEEVFAPLPAALRDFLLNASSLERISSELAAVVYPHDDARALFDSLIDHDLFVTELDSGSEWIELHPLFRKYLRRKATRVNAAATNRTLTQAAVWHWQQDDWQQAVSYAIDAGETAMAEQWLLSCSDRVIDNLGEVGAFRAACERLVSVHNPGSDLLILMIWTAAFSIPWFETSRMLHRHAKRLKCTGESAQRVSMIRAMLTFCSHEFPRLIEQAEAWWDMKDQCAPLDRAAVAGMLAVSYRAQLNLKKAKVWCDQARRDIARAPGCYGGVWIDATTAFLLLEEGRPREACQVIENSLAQPGLSNSSRISIEPLLAAAFYELNRIEEAAKVVESFTVTMDGCGSFEIAFGICTVVVHLESKRVGMRQALALIDAWAGRLERRYGHRSALKCQLLRRDVLSRLPNQECPELRGRSDGIREMSERDGWNPDTLEWWRIIQAREMLADGNARAALDMVRNIVLSSRGDGRLTTWLQASMIKAAAQRSLGDIKAGERILVDCLDQAAPLGIRRTILDQALLLRPFGTFLQKHEKSLQRADGDMSELIRLLLVEMEFASGIDDNARDHLQVEALTKQETRILGLLAQGLTNAEICERLCLSRETIKWHVSNLFQKFGVHTRMAAVREGRIFGLIE